MNPVGGNTQKLMVGLDGSDNAAAALAWAVEEAGVLGASIEVTFAWQVPSLAYCAPGYIPFERSDIEVEGRRVFDGAVARVPASSGINIHLNVVEGSPVEALVSAASDPEVGLVVLGARGHGVVATALLGSVSHAMTHRCPKPLVLVPGDWDVSARPPDRRNIVVGVDGSADADLALAWAVAEGRRRDVPVDAVLVWPTPTPVLSSHLSLQDMVEGGHDSKVRDIVSAAIERVDTTGVTVEAKVVQGHPAARLTELATTGALLVVGTRGHGRAHEAVTGSVSHACTHHSRVPVVVVPGPR